MNEIIINKEEYNDLKEIKTEFNKTVAKLDDVIIQNIKLKQENEELKILIESNRQQVEHSEMLIYDNDYLLQKLEKIKEIVKTACEDSVCHKDCENCSDGQILQIIEEDINKNN